MDRDNMLMALKVDLGITTSAYDNRLSEYIEAAIKAIEIEGINLDTEDISDAMLAVMYAGWLWKKRDTGDGMSRMLRWCLNNRLFSQKVNE